MLLALFILLILVYSLVSAKMERTIVTAPILFTAAGIVVALASPNIFVGGANRSIFLGLAEFGLVLLLFCDASRTGLHVLSSIRNLPGRLLSAGMLLTILLGAVIARLVFPGLSIWEAGILAAILAPTDAGLGQVIVNSPRVPTRIRQALNVEAGLNDGLAVPFMLFFTALAASGQLGGEARLYRHIMEQLGLGVLVGGVIGLLGGWLIGYSVRQKWMSKSYLQIGVVALPVLCMLVSHEVDASMFIAAFVAGLAVQVGFRKVGKHSTEFSEEWGQLINLSVFFLFGLLVAHSWQDFDFIMVIYAVLSLTVVRMLPVAISLIGSRMSAASVVFMGWFGPRGLASIVLGLVYLEQEYHLPGESTIRLAVMMTVGLSIFAHGFSALPGIWIYEKKIALLADDSPERQEVES